MDCVSLVGSEIRKAHLSPAIPALLSAHSLQRTRSRKSSSQRRLIIQQRPTSAQRRLKTTRLKHKSRSSFWAIEPLDPKGKLCEKYCDEWNQELSFFGRRLGHNYQTTDKALEYYRLEMKNNCDNKC